MKNRKKNIYDGDNRNDIVKEKNYVYIKIKRRGFIFSWWVISFISRIGHKGQSREGIEGKVDHQQQQHPSHDRNNAI